MEEYPELAEINKQLNLSYEPQDWGIANAAPGRVIEFIDFYESRESTPNQKDDLMELIIASINDGLLDEPLSDADLERCRQFIRSHKDDAPYQRRYWRSLANEDEFPVAGFLLDNGW